MLYRILIALFLVSFVVSPLAVQTPTVDLFLNDAAKSFSGYTLFAPLQQKTTFLIDNEVDWCIHGRVNLRRAIWFICWKTDFCCTSVMSIILPSTSAARADAHKSSIGAEVCSEILNTPAINVYNIKMLNIYLTAINPVPVSRWNNWSGEARAAFVKDDYAYVAYVRSLVILDIGNPSAPSYVVYYPIAGECNDVVIEDNYAFVLASSGLLVLDIPNPANPNLVTSQMGVLDRPLQLAVNKPYVYVACQDGAIYTFEFGGFLSVKEFDKNMRLSFALKQNHPNPLNPSTTIRFSLPQREQETLKIFDVLGREVGTLVHGQLDAAEYSIVFDAAGLANGVYFYRFITPTMTLTKSMAVLK